MLFSSQRQPTQGRSHVTKVPRTAMRVTWPPSLVALHTRLRSFNATVSDLDAKWRRGLARYANAVDRSKCLILASMRLKRKSPSHIYRQAHPFDEHWDTKRRETSDDTMASCKAMSSQFVHVMRGAKDGCWPGGRCRGPTTQYGAYLSHTAFLNDTHHTTIKYTVQLSGLSPAILLQCCRR